MIKLIALDFDGTVAARKQPVDEVMLSYIRKWKRLGIETIVASGRPFRSLAREWDIFSGEIPIISNNGNLIRYKNSKKTIYKQGFPKEYLLPVVDAMIEKDIHPIFHVDAYDKGYDLVTLFPQTEREATYISFYENKFRLMTKEEIIKEDVLVVAGYTTKEEYDALLEEDAIKNHGLTLHLLKSKDPKLSLIEVVGSASKWQALSAYSEMNAIFESEILAVGDDMNDASMIEHAAVGIAMSTAPENVKNVADVICHTSPEDYGAFKIVDEIIGKEIGIEY